MPASRPQAIPSSSAPCPCWCYSQHTVVENLARLKCTRIVIAHRLSTIEQCNRIIVLKDGRVAADGNFEELRREGYFANA